MAVPFRSHPQNLRGVDPSSLEKFPTSASVCASSVLSESSVASGRRERGKGQPSLLPVHKSRRQDVVGSETVPRGGYSLPKAASYVIYAEEPDENVRQVQRHKRKHRAPRGSQCVMRDGQAGRDGQEAATVDNTCQTQTQREVAHSNRNSQACLATPSARRQSTRNSTPRWLWQST